MTFVSARLRARIQRDFPESETRNEILALLNEASEDERVQASIIFWANGDVDRFLDAVGLAGEDWRDVLVNGGLADDDWRAKMDLALGPSTA